MWLGCGGQTWGGIFGGSGPSPYLRYQLSANQVREISGPLSGAGEEVLVTYGIGLPEPRPGDFLGSR